MQNKKSPPEGRLFNIKTHGVLFPFSRIANADARGPRIWKFGKTGEIRVLQIGHILHVSIIS